MRLTSITVGMFLTLAALLPGPARAQEQALMLQGVDAHGAQFDLVWLRGNVVALTFVSRYTQDEAHQVLEALSRRGDVKMVNVVDFTGIPRFVHGFVKKKVAQAATGRVQHLCDENGRLGRQVGADPGHRVDIFIIDRDGIVRGHYAGASQLAAAERKLDEVRSTQASR